MTLPPPFGRQPFDPFRPLRDLEREFRDWPFSSGWPFRGRGQESTTPAVEVFEREGMVIVRAEVPGMRPGDVRVSFSEGAIVIEGERRSEHLEGGAELYVCEREYGAFRRRVALPAPIDPARAQATVADGLLTVTAPRLHPPGERVDIPIV